MGFQWGLSPWSIGFSELSSYRMLHPYGLNGKAALGSLPRQHDAVSPIQHGIGHITCLCPSWSSLSDHALQHLGDTMDSKAVEVTF